MLFRSEQILNRYSEINLSQWKLLELGKLTREEVLVRRYPLAAGDYELYEVAAPYGYVLSDQPVPFTIDGSEAVVTAVSYTHLTGRLLSTTRS